MNFTKQFYVIVVRRGINPVKNPNSACLNYLDNGIRDWNFV